MQLVRTSQHINYNRLSTTSFSPAKRLALLAAGVMEAARCQALLKRRAKVECNLCGWQGRSFINFYTGYGHVYPKAVCPSCYSHPRHRSYAFSLEKLLNSNGKKKVLHFSPERMITEIICSYADIDYLSVDIDHTKAMRKEDITALSFPSNSFDYIVCVHVFEHISDDRKAMDEVYRVLKPGGVALLDVPIDHNREETYEDWSITSPEERTKAFWQWDHVRLYGRDYPQKLRAVGFSVKEDQLISHLPEHQRTRFGLEAEPNYLCTKP